MAKQLCMNDGCGTYATVQVCFRVWAKNQPKLIGQAATGKIGMHLCRACSRKLLVHELFTEEAKERISKAFAQGGKAQPDLDNPDIYFEPLIV